MNDDEDDVLGIDLDAWQPPPPPDVADGVVARMRSETTSVTAQALPVETPRRAPQRRWWVVGAAAAAIATTTVVTFALTRGPANTRGVSAGDRAAHIAIGPTTADIDPNTAVSWRRDGDQIEVKQAGGAAAWRVDEDDTLTIETGLASIQATNASLRVEVKMLDDKKTIALSALTAAAVAAVTIVVYEGVVKTDGVTVAPGTAYRITGKSENVIVEDLEVSAADFNARIDALERELAEARAAVAAAGKPPPDDFNRQIIAPTMVALTSRIKSCGMGYVGALELRVDVRADGSVRTVETSPAAAPGACIEEIVRDAVFPRTKDGGRFTYPIVFAAPVVSGDLGGNPFAKKTCDAEQLLAQGKTLYSASRAAEALVKFEAAHHCKPSPSTASLALAAACSIKHLPKARFYWKQTSPQQRGQLLTMCVRRDITQADLEAEPTTTGTLHIVNAEPARVLLDGVAIGTTPLSVEVGPGKHKVTLVVGVDKHTFAVQVKAGETTRLEKQLRQLE